MAAKLVLDAEMRQMHDAHRSNRTKLKTLGQVGTGLTAGLLLVMMGFLFSIYGKMTTNYTPQKFEEPLRQEAENLLPKLEAELQTLWAETAPVYGELALAKFEAALPDFLETSRVEFETLRANLLAHVEEQLRHSLDRIARNRLAQLETQFPRLSSPETAEDLGLIWMETVASDCERILRHFQDNFIRDLGELEATLEGFLPSEFEHLSEEQLARQFVHLWLMKVDELIVTGDQMMDGVGDASREARS